MNAPFAQDQSISSGIQAKSTGPVGPTVRYIKKYPAAADISYVGKLDIKGEYPWTLSNNVKLRNYVPGVILTEYHLTRNGEIQALINSVLGIAESNFATGIAGAALGGVALNAVRPFLTAAAAAVPAAGGVGARLGTILSRVLLSNAGGTAVSAGVGAAGGLALRELALKDDILAPYRGLYPAIHTGNEYVLPYLNVDNMTSEGGSWRSIDDTNLSSKIGTVIGGIAGASQDPAWEARTRQAGAMYKALKTISQLEVALSQPGAAQEKIKAFTPNDTGDSINVSFYLYNTTDNLEYLMLNWGFLWHLTYQNLPNRKSINAIDPPCVYEVEIPGFKRFPIAVIESFKVTNEGTTRMVDFETGNIANYRGPTVKIIPEAYKVSLKITSLLSNTRNLHYYMYDQIENRVNVFDEKTDRETQEEAATPAQRKVKEATGTYTGIPATGGARGGVVIPPGGFKSFPTP